MKKTNPNVFFPHLEYVACYIALWQLTSLLPTRAIYYITFTCYQWHPLITITNAYDLFYNWFDILASKRHFVTGYVIMPNHVHVIIFYSGGRQSFNTIIGNGKRFIAYEIVNRLVDQKEITLLEQMKLAVRSKDKNRGKKHEIWQDTFDIKECRTEQFILQKLNYIHNNPCSGKWKLSKEPHHYQHSSALFYLNGKTHHYTVRDYRNFLSMYDTEE